MDPFLECQEWDDFHPRFNLVIAELLKPLVRPRYVVRCERRVYVEHTLEDEVEFRRPDVVVQFVDAAAQKEPQSVVAEAPVECLLPISDEEEETYLVLRERESMEVVTVFETLSPANKRRGSEGRRVYLAKRDGVLRSPVHLVELDLLRGGLRPPLATRRPPGDYYAMVSRAERRPRAHVHGWSIRRRMPRIGIPLKTGDEDVVLDLQEAFAVTYDRADYELSLDYSSPVRPPVSEADESWLKQILQRTAK
jgi:hypothetical protein